jgi:hypothetical protein
MVYRAVPDADCAGYPGDAMTDARWLDIEADATSSVNHFAHAVQIYRGPDLHEQTMDGYVRRMAFMHAMLAGHTSFGEGPPADIGNAE